MKKILSTFLFTIICSFSLLAQVGEKVSVISFNIRYDNPADSVNNWRYRRQNIIKMINLEQPSLLCTQELLDNQRLFLSESLPNYSHIGVGRDDGGHGGEHLAIFYRKDLYELLDNGDFWLSETPDHVSKGWDAACYRITTWGYFKCKKSGNTFYCFNTHLDHVGKRARQESLLLINRKIQETARDENAAIFLAGDFNTGSDDKIFLPLQMEMYDARKRSAITDNCGTYNNFGKVSGDVVIDHIFYKNAQVELFKTLNGSQYGTRYISDHFPVKSTFLIDPYPIGTAVKFNFRGNICEGIIVDKNGNNSTISFTYKSQKNTPISALYTTSNSQILSRIKEHSHNSNSAIKL